MASPLLPAQLEVLAGDELLDGEVGGQLDQLGEGQLREPFGVEADQGFLAVQHFVSLLGVGAGIVLHLLRG